MARPSPAPGESAPFTNRSKARGSRSGGKPGPSSWTTTATPGCGLARVRSGGQGHVSARRRVAKGVGQQVADDLPKADRVGLDGRQLVGHVGRDLHVALGCLGGSRRRPRRSSRAPTSTGSRCSARPPASAWATVRRSSTSRSRVVMASRIGRQVRGIGRIDAVRDGLDVGPHDGQRRAQLVRHVGQEAAAFSLVDGQPGAHLVEGSRQCPRLARTALADLHVEIAGLDAPAAATRSSTGSVRPRSQRALPTTASTTSSEDGQPDHDADARAGPDETGVGPGHGRHEHGAEGDEDDDRAAESLGRPRTPPTPRRQGPTLHGVRRHRLAGGQGSVSGHQGGRCRCLMRRARRIGSRRRRPSGGIAASADRARSCAGCS